MILNFYQEFDMHDFMDINQLSKEFLDNFRTESKISDSNSPSGRAVKGQFKSKLFKMVRNKVTYYIIRQTNVTAM